MAITIKRLDPTAEGPIGSFSMKRVRLEIIRRVRMLAADRNWTLEYTTDRLLQVGLDAYDAEDGAR